jgi:hypothetical protein
MTCSRQEDHRSYFQSNGKKEVWGFHLATSAHSQREVLRGRHIVQHAQCEATM